MSANPTRVLQVRIEDANPGNVKEFGWLVGSNAGREGTESVYYPGSMNWRFDEFDSDDDTNLVLSRPKPREMRVRWMERHAKHTQTFIPLGGRAFVMVLAPPGGELPDLDAVRAFRIDGSQALMLKKDCWHDYPYAIQSNTDLLIIMRRETMDNLGAKTFIDGETHAPDVEKNDLQARLGVTIELSFGAPQTEIG